MNKIYKLLISIFLISILVMSSSSVVANSSVVAKDMKKDVNDVNKNRQTIKDVMIQNAKNAQASAQANTEREIKEITRYGPGVP